MNRKAKQQGFTLIELVLAMSFIAVLLLAIAMTIIQVGNIYNRGMTLKEVNQAGRVLSSAFSRDFKTSDSFSIVPADHRYVERTSKTGGQLCLGQYSYIWNFGKSIKAGSTDLAKKTDGTVIRFVKVNDNGGNYCLSNTAYKSIQSTDGPDELLKVGDRDLSLHEFTVKSGAGAYDPSTGQRLFSVTFTIGTSDINVLNSTQSACRGPGETGGESDLAYCAIQQFVLVLRAGNGVN